MSLDGRVAGKKLFALPAALDLRTAPLELEALPVAFEGLENDVGWSIADSLEILKLRTAPVEALPAAFENVNDATLIGALSVAFQNVNDTGALPAVIKPKETSTFLAMW